MKQILSFLIALLFLSSCESKHSGRLMMNAEDEEMMPMTKQAVGTPASPLDEFDQKVVDKKKIIKDGRLELEVKNLEKAKHRIDSLVRVYEGYYSNENFNNTSREFVFELTVRVPSVNFEKLIGSIESGDGEITSKEIEARDVTDQFIDLESRLENKKKYLERYRELLKEAKTVKDILEIEENIRGIEEEIESTQGRLKYLSDLVGYSTLRLRIFKEKDIRIEPEKRAKFFSRLKHSLSAGWIGFVDFLLSAIALWPFFIAIAALVLILKKGRKKKS